MPHRAFSLILFTVLAACNSSNAPKVNPSVEVVDEESPPVTNDSPSDFVVTRPSLDQHFDRVIAVNPHVTVMLRTGGLFPYRAVLTQAQRIPAAIAAQPFMFFRVPIKDRPGSSVALKGVDPSLWLNVMGVEQHVTNGDTDLSWEPASGVAPPAIIGHSLAKKYKLGLGEILTLDARGDGLREQDFRVIGIFDMQYEEYDSGLVITHINGSRALLDDRDQGRAQGVEVRLRTAGEARETAKILQAKIGDSYNALGWCELNYETFAELCAPKEQITGTRVSNEGVCDEKDGAACLRLGRMWAEGHDGKQDRSKARSLYEKSCKLRNAEGCEELGLTWIYGAGGPVDLVKARSHLQTACELGSMQGCKNLGFLFDTGMGGPEDRNRAVELFGIACAGGEIPSCTNHAAGLSLGFKFEEAREIYKKGCDQDSDIACDELGRMWASGIGGELSKEQGQLLMDKAKRLYKVNCEKGYDMACAKLRASQTKQ